MQDLVFCSRREEAKRLSNLFNRQINQQTERPYRTKAITGENSQTERDEAVEQLERGDLDYIFTVDLFNEGVDIPHVNQIVMLRQTKSSIIFTQQLGRGLRKASGKDCVVVIDFIGNYTNNYLIPIALYGNTGDRDVARKNLQRETIGISSISFDKISRERVLASLDTADLSNMKLLSRQYQQMRYELGRIPIWREIHCVRCDAPVRMGCRAGAAECRRIQAGCRYRFVADFLDTPAVETTGFLRTGLAWIQTIRLNPEASHF